MLLTDFEKIIKVTSELMETFGVQDIFQEEWIHRCLEINKIICEEFDVKKVSYLPPFYTTLLPKSESAVQEFKKWFAEIITLTSIALN